MYSGNELLLCLKIAQSLTNKDIIYFLGIPYENDNADIISGYIKTEQLFNNLLNLCLFSSWDNGEVEKMSPWDLEPISEDSKY